MRSYLFVAFAIAIILYGLLMAAASRAQSFISPDEGRAKVKAGALLLDVRTPKEFASGHLDGALNIPYDQLTERAGEIGTDKRREIVTYCEVGARSEAAKETLQELGFTAVYNGGGYRDWLR